MSPFSVSAGKMVAGLIPGPIVATGYRSNKCLNFTLKFPFTKSVNS